MASIGERQDAREAFRRVHLSMVGFDGVAIKAFTSMGLVTCGAMIDIMSIFAREDWIAKTGLSREALDIAERDINEFKRAYMTGWHDAVDNMRGD